MKNIYWQRLIKDINMNVTNHPIAHSKNGTYSNFIYWSSCWNHSANLIYSLSSIRRCARTKSSCVYANWVRKFYHPKFTQIQFDFRVGFRQRLFFLLDTVTVHVRPQIILISVTLEAKSQAGILKKIFRNMQNVVFSRNKISFSCSREWEQIGLHDLVKLKFERKSIWLFMEHVLRWDSHALQQ